jgi:hypothetical protein
MQHQYTLFNSSSRSVTIDSHIFLLMLRVFHACVTFEVHACCMCYVFAVRVVCRGCPTLHAFHIWLARCTRMCLTSVTHACCTSCYVASRVVVHAKYVYISCGLKACCQCILSWDTRGGRTLMPSIRSCNLHGWVMVAPAI